MASIVLFLLFLGALLLAIGHIAPAPVCLQLGAVLLTVGFGIQLFGALV